MHTFKSYIDHLTQLKLHHISVSKEVVDDLGGIGTRLLCSINNHKAFHCGLVALGGGRAYITLSKTRMTEFGVEMGEEVDAVLTIDNSKYGMEMPEELEALLEQDAKGLALFLKLTPGQQRYIIYYVAQVKSSQLKIDRSIMLINNLKTMNPAKFDFRYLLGKPPREK